MAVKKSVVLSGLQNTCKAVLSYRCEDGKVNGRVRLYNFSSEPAGILSLGIATEGKVIKAGLVHKDAMLFSFSLDGDLPEKFSCAVVNFSGGEGKAILYGASEGRCEQKERLCQAYADVQKATSASEVEKILDEKGIDFDKQEKEDIEREIDKACGDCGGCIYKKAFFEEQPKQENQAQELYNEEKIRSILASTQDDDEEKTESEKEEKNEELQNSEEIENVEENIENITEEKLDEELPFYEQLKPQLDELFENGQREVFLEEMFENSKWIKVELSQESIYYVLGLIEENGQIKLICYGVPGIFEQQPPKILSGYPVFLPLDSEKPKGFGYWITCQDARTGESIKMED